MIDYDVKEIPTESAEDFYFAIWRVKKEHESSGADQQLTNYTLGEYQHLRLFLSENKASGFALQGDNMVAVFSHPDKNQHALPNLVQTAVANGGRRVDIFDTFLPRIYAREGFKEVARVKWNDEYAPARWDFEAMKQYNGGRPDVVFMVYDPSSRVPVVPGYEEAEELQRSALSKIVV